MSTQPTALEAAIDRGYAKREAMRERAEKKVWRQAVEREVALRNHERAQFHAARAWIFSAGFLVGILVALLLGWAGAVLR